MGLPNLMEDIHAPTVPSGQTTNGASQDGVDKAIPLPELIAKKENMEAELSALGSVLDSHGVNMNTTLTTFDGYPRDDIDIAQIRTTRARIVRLRNDYKAMLGRIEEGLHAHHAQLQSDQAQATSRATPGTSISASNVAESAIQAPFAKVNSVSPNSPADTAGLRPGDRITVFGSANWMNHEKLGKVAEVVSQHEGVRFLLALD
ncbi:MAG: putative 26S proteasome regulatory subunit [Bogoriella megaspora]|nr:MAG: putative 26S proteasome regulatory subunit [Bogoriella megaspora]